MDGERWNGERRDSIRWRNRMEKGNRVYRSPQQEQDVKGIRRRLEETDLEGIFGSISKVMRREMEAVVGKAPRLMQESMKEGMDVMVRAVEETMSRISEREKWEGRERKEKEGRSYKLLFRPRNVILAFLSSHYAKCNNQGRHFDERKVKKPFLSFEYKLQYICTLVLGLSNRFFSKSCY